MTKIVKKKLPHGKVPFEEIANPQTKTFAMKTGENVVALARQLEELQSAVMELQRRM